MGLLDDIKNYNSLAIEAKNNIKTVYKHDNRPWVIGYSGGKDSTTVTQLVIESLIEMKKDNIELHKPVYIISSDTMVETPLIIARLSESLKDIDKYVLEENLPVETHLVTPALDNTFWVNVIGKGYPVPNQSFRWCTDRMKIEPTNRFIKEKISTHGEVIVLLGVREGESSSRDRVIQSHSIEGKLIMQHSSLSNAYTFAPIRNFGVDDVWNYLLNNNSPWGFDNEELFKMYSESNSSECPLIIDQETKEKSGSCGNSRFGCWACTVVNEDKALSGFVNNGEEWLRPLVDYRNWLSKHRDDRSKRMKMRANGSVYLIKIKTKLENNEEYIVIPAKSGRKRVQLKLTGEDKLVENDVTYNIVNENELSLYLKNNNIDLTKGDNPNLIVRMGDGTYSLLGLGPYTFEMRFEMIEKLLKMQKELNDNGHEVTLIKNNELRQIRREWLRRGLIEDKMSEIFAKIYQFDLNWEENDINLLSNSQYKTLSEICQNEGIYVQPLIELIRLEKENSNTRFKRNISERINNILTKDYLHY